MANLRTPYSGNTPRATSVTSKRALTAREREREALRLRQTGYTLDEIAQRLGYAHRSGASKAISRLTQRHSADAVDELRALEAGRYDAAQVAIWPRVLKGDLHATREFVRISAARRRLLGLDMPSKREHTFRDEIRAMTERIGEELGMDPQSIIAEAERLLAARD